MTSSTTAALEWAAHASAAAIITHSTGSPAIAAKYTHAGSVLGRRQRVQQDMQGQQHKTEANRHPAQVVGACATA
jgi:hypothetical protein